MKVSLSEVKLKKPKTRYEKDESSSEGVVPVTTLTIDVRDMDSDELMMLARYAAYQQPLNVTIESAQMSFERMAESWDTEKLEV